MIGIDIVDHSDVLLKKRSLADLRFISHPKDSHAELIDIEDERIWWAYWASKEAIYKVYRKRKKFSPKEIPVQLYQAQQEYGLTTIRFSSNGILGKLTLSQTSTLAVASSDRVERFHFDSFDLEGTNSSHEVRNKCTQFLEKKGLEFIDITIPAAKKHNRDRDIEVSISHHGRLGAFMVNMTGIE